MAVTDSSEPDINHAPATSSPASPASSLKAALSPLFAGTGGIDSWILEETNLGVVERLLQIDDEPLGRSQLNQLLVMGKEAGVSEDFFHYYWLSTPSTTG